MTGRLGQEAILCYGFQPAWRHRCHETLHKVVDRTDSSPYSCQRAVAISAMSTIDRQLQKVALCILPEACVTPQSHMCGCCLYCFVCFMGTVTGNGIITDLHLLYHSYLGSYPCIRQFQSQCPQPCAACACIATAALSITMTLTLVPSLSRYTTADTIRHRLLD